MTNTLIIGSGGREHAFAWKIAQSPLNGKLYVAPGNAGTATIAENVAISPEDFEALGIFCIQQSVDLVVVGPEVPLVAGIANYFQETPALEHIAVIGPVKNGALLEGSKDWSKRFMQKHQIPTAMSRTFGKQQLADAHAFLESMSPPYVLKADGLAAGKGVIITEDIAEAKVALQRMLEGQFGEASHQVLVEEYMHGIELSVFVLTDGKDYCILPSAKDYKRIGEGDTGPNTGGMGAISPVPFADGAFMAKVEDTIIRPTIDGLRHEGIAYKGFIFFGLMKVGDTPKVIEYNCRMGDPETEAVFPRLKSDLLELLLLAGRGELSAAKLSIDPRTAATLVIVSEGYPGSYPKGRLITGIPDAQDDMVVFHAGTMLESQQILSSGGRVLAVTALGADMPAALDAAYQTAANIKFGGMYYRKDIGFDLA